MISKDQTSINTKELSIEILNSTHYREFIDETIVDFFNFQVSIKNRIGLETKEVKYCKKLIKEKLKEYDDKKLKMIMFLEFEIYSHLRFYIIHYACFGVVRLENDCLYPLHKHPRNVMVNKITEYWLAKEGLFNHVRIENILPKYIKFLESEKEHINEKCKKIDRVTNKVLIKQPNNNAKALNENKLIRNKTLLNN